jgi:hypothetical protein
MVLALANKLVPNQNTNTNTNSHNTQSFIFSKKKLKV